MHPVGCLCRGNYNRSMITKTYFNLSLTILQLSGERTL